LDRPHVRLEVQEAHITVLLQTAKTLAFRLDPCYNAIVAHPGPKERAGTDTVLASRGMCAGKFRRLGESREI